MIVHYFRYDPEAAVAPEPRLPCDVHISCWQPEAQGYPPRGSRRLANHFWWALTKTGRFARKGFTEIRIERDRTLLHRLIVTPAWYRFPFMAAGDLQIGHVWTSPTARRQKLARAAISEAHRRFASDGGKFWYVADADNLVSAALARSCGYRLVATGRRTRRYGARLLGQYVIERYV